MTATEFFVLEWEPPFLLRRVDYIDEIFVNGRWKPTKDIIDWMFGENNSVSEIDESEARKLAPAAFT